MRLTPDERRKFENHVEQSDEFSSLSRFFRVLVHRHIDTDDDQPSLDPDEIVEPVDQALTPLSTQLDQIEEQVLSIDANVRDEDVIDRLARDIYSSLPTHQRGTDFPALDDLDELENHANTSDFALVQAISTPFMWSRYYTEELQDVRRACARMLEYYPDVDYVHGEIGGSSNTHIPRHDNLGLNQSTPHTDVGTGTDNGESDDNATSSVDASQVRRYYKTGGAECAASIQGFRGLS